MLRLLKCLAMFYFYLLKTVAVFEINKFSIKVEFF